MAGWPNTLGDNEVSWGAVNMVGARNQDPKWPQLALVIASTNKV